MVSVGPAVLYSKKIEDIARNVELNSILTETDGPVKYYGPFKGRETKPSFVLEVVQKLAEIRSQSVETVRESICNNFQTMISNRR